jgi:predicted KAP-like P-loop ATPase
LSPNNDSSTAIGIVAPWGYGKSTILNFMKEELETYRNKDKNKNKVLFFDFNPWIYSKRSNLTSEYINTLQKKLELRNENETWQDLAEILKELHPLLTPPLWKKWEEKVGELFEAKTID